MDNPLKFYQVEAEVIPALSMCAPSTPPQGLRIAYAASLLHTLLSGVWLSRYAQRSRPTFQLWKGGENLIVLLALILA